MLFALLFATALVLLRSALPETPESAPDWPGDASTGVAIVLGGGILFLAMVFVATAIAGAPLSTVESGNEVDASVAMAGRAIILQILNVYALRMAGLFMLSLGTLWLRMGALPNWTSLFTYAVAAVLLFVTSLSVWVSLIFPAWAFAISVFLLVRNYRPPAPRLTLFRWPRRAS